MEEIRETGESKQKRGETSNDDLNCQTRVYLILVKGSSQKVRPQTRSNLLVERSHKNVMSSAIVFFNERIAL